MVQQKRRYVVVAGNMGVGKSTLVQFLASQFNATAFYEPVDENPYFAKFFKDMRSWSFHSQIFFLTHKFKIHQEVGKTDGLAVLDRSIYEDAEIFAQGLYKAKKMSKDEFKLYWDLYEAMLLTLRPPDLLIYLTCSFKTLKERVAKRGRTAEKAVPDAHIKRLQRAYDDWVSRVKFCEVVTMSTDNLDYISDDLHRAHVIQHLAKLL